jgi:hypothetical protein
VTGVPRHRRGSALLGVLLGLVVLAILAAMAASLAALSLRSAGGALDTVAGEAAVEEGLVVAGVPVPETPGSSLEVGYSPPPPAGWIGHRTVTRLAGGLVLVRVTVERQAPGGRVLARSGGGALWLIADSGGLDRVPGGWVGDP